VDAAGRVFVAPSQAGLGAVQRTPIVTPQAVLPFGFAQTGALSDMSMVSMPIPEADAAALALVACAALSAIRVRRRRSLRV
jgi:hypothetical protein